MSITRFRWVMSRSHWAAVGVVLLGLCPASGEEKTAAPSGAPAFKQDLTPESFRALWSLVRPQESEWRHLKIQWLTDVVAARKKAADEDKPLVVLYTGGAGYNEPLGVC